MDQRQSAALTPFLTLLAILALLITLASVSVRSHSARFYHDVPQGRLSLESAGLASGSLGDLSLHGSETYSD